MAKNLDGIKKLNPEEIRKNRRIVLNYIGENEPESTKKPEVAIPIVPAFNKVDGIKSNKIFSLKPKVKSMPEGPVLPEDNQESKQKIDLEKEKIKREELARKAIAEKAKREAEEKLKAEAAKKKFKEEEIVKKAIAEKAKREAEEKLKAEAAKKRHERLKLEEKIKEERRIAEENSRLEKIKRAVESAKIKEEIKLSKNKSAVKRKLKRQKAIKRFRKNLNNKLSDFFSAVKQNFVYAALYFTIFIVIAYAVFCLLVLRFKINNNIIISEIERFLPVPAVITSQGAINYNDFREIKINNYANLSLAEKKNSLARWLILKKLSEKYDLSVNFFDEALALNFITDEDFNQAGLFRIKKISELLKDADDLEKLSKYADEYSDVVYYNEEEAINKFGPAIFSLKANQASDIIFRNNGYYIAQSVDNKNNELGVKYLFVGAKTLDQYVSEKLAQIKIFILAN